MDMHFLFHFKLVLSLFIFFFVFTFPWIYSFTDGYRNFVAIYWYIFSVIYGNENEFGKLKTLFI